MTGCELGTTENRRHESHKLEILKSLKIVKKKKDYGIQP